MEGADVVTWRAGRVGKGWVFPDGRVRAWSVSDREEPNHSDVEHPDGSTRFRISPEGVTEVHGELAWVRERAQAAIDAAVDEDD